MSEERTTVCWREVVANARARGHFTLEEKTLASASWRTCAIGEQHAHHQGLGVLVPTVKYGGEYLVPATAALKHLGGTTSDAIIIDAPKSQWGFAAAVEYDEFDIADQRLDEIEDLVLKMKREKRT